MNRRISYGFLFILLQFASGCLPSSKLNVALKLEDAATGNPIAGAWVVTVADIDYVPLREEPYSKAVAAARGMTDSNGSVELKKVEGIYFGQEPKDQLWLMLESRKPKVDRRITGIQAGSMLIFAKDYGFIHQPFTVKKADDDYAGWINFGEYELNQKSIHLDAKAIASKKTITIKVRKPDNAETASTAFQTQMLAMLMSGMSKHTGATAKEKEALYNFFLRNMEEAARTSGDIFYANEYTELARPEVKQEVLNWKLEVVAENHDTVLHEWLTQKALENLPLEYEEVKKYAEAVRQGIKDEDTGLRSVHHFYNPETGAGLGSYTDALKWGAIGYPNNADNEWDLEDALAYYKKGDKENAYKALGHVLHLLEDMSSPMHTRGIIHPLGAERRFEKYFSGLLKENNNSLPMEYRQSAESVKTKEIKQQFEDLAKLTFTSFIKDGRRIGFNEYYQQGKLKALPDDETLQAMGKALFPGTIAQAERLAKNFYIQANPERYAQAVDNKKQSQTATDASLAEPAAKAAPSHGRIERVKESGNEIIRVFNKDGEKIREFHLGMKDVKVRVSKKQKFNPSSISVYISSRVADAIENTRKESGRDVVLYRRESHWSSLGGNGKFVAITDDYADFVEVSDALDGERTEEATEISNTTSVYDSEGNKILELNKEDGWQPVVSNTGNYFIVTVGEYERHRIINRQKKLMAEVDYHSGRKFFSSDDGFVFMENHGVRPYSRQLG